MYFLTKLFLRFRPLSLTVAAFIFISSFFVGIPGAQAAVNFETSAGLVVIPVEVKGKTLRAILDTGASVNALDSSLAGLGVLSEQTKTLNFSDRFGGKAKVVNAQVSVDGIPQDMEFALTKTRPQGNCCDMILGKPFLEKNRVLLEFSSNQLLISPKTLPTGRRYQFKIAKAAKELLVSCRANGKSTLARLDLGSQQATDVTGAFAQSLKMLDKSSVVFLDSMLQPGIGLDRIDAKCGDWKLDPDVPALINPVSSTGLGQGEAGLNLGLPWLKRFDILVDLPHSQVTLFERKSPPPVAFNSLHALFANEPNRGVIAKAVLAGGAADDLGLKVDDQLLAINETEVRTAEQTYQIIESRPVGAFAIRILRQGQPMNLSGIVKSLFPRKVTTPQSFYGMSSDRSRANGVGNGDKSEPLTLGKVKSARMVMHQISADFAIARKLQGLQVRDLLFKPLDVALQATESELRFEGMRLSRERKVAIDLARSQPSLSLDCKKQTLQVELQWVTPLIADFVQDMQGCGSRLRIEGSFYLSESLSESLPEGLPERGAVEAEQSASASQQSPQEASQEKQSPFFYLSDQRTGKAARWSRSSLTLALDTRAPEWVEQAAQAAIQQYNEILSPTLTLKIERRDLASTSLSDPAVLGIYWHQDGHAFDRETRFALSRVMQDPVSGEIIDADILLREPEFKQHEKLVTSIATEAANRNPGAKAKLTEFAQAKIQALRRNVVLHELGHLLGLGHNFSEKEKSVMSYATIEKLSDYDRAALKFHYQKQNPPRAFDLEAQPAHQDIGFD